MANRITSASRSIKILSRFAQPSNALFNGWFGGASDVGRVHEKSIDNPQEEILRLVGRLWAERSAHESAGYLSTPTPDQTVTQFGVLR